MGKQGHIQSDDEQYFGDWLGEALQEAREAEAVSQRKIAELTGYSIPQIQRFERVPESNSRERKGSIPAYVLMWYARACRTTAEKLCEEWIKTQNEEADPEDILNAVNEKKLRNRLGALTRLEKNVIWHLRHLREQKKNKGPSTESIICNLRREDFETEYCLRMIGSENDELESLIRSQIYNIYMKYCSDDDKRVRDAITRNLRHEKTTADITEEI